MQMLTRKRHFPYLQDRQKDRKVKLNDLREWVFIADFSHGQMS